MNLLEFLENWTREFGPCSGQLLAVSFNPPLSAPATMDLVIIAPHWIKRGASSPEVLRVEFERVEDWAIRPSHNLLEGFHRLRLVTDHPKLTRPYLESLDCEGIRTEFPDNLCMLEFGDTYVIAQEFRVRWITAG